jgi:hypothetical protein
VNSDQARQRAQRSFKKEERAQDGRAAVMEYETEARVTREKTARLKALRLAKEAETVIALGTSGYAVKGERDPMRTRICLRSP